MSMKERGLVPVTMRGGKRANLGHHSQDENDEPSATRSDWDCWVGWGKDESCQFEGPWAHMAILAANILRHPNTAKVAPNLHVELTLTKEQEEMY